MRFATAFTLILCSLVRAINAEVLPPIRSSSSAELALPQALSGQAAAAPPGIPFPGGWDRLVTRWASGQEWKPSRMSIRSKELGKDGSVISVEETVLSLRYPHGPDKPVSEILQATKDGKDVTTERRSKAPNKGGFGGGGPPGGLEFPDPFPFGSKALGKASLSLSRPSFSGFDTFSYRIDGKTAVVGKLWLAAGEPYSLEYTLDPLPFYLKSFSGEAYFALAPDASLVTKELSFDADAEVVFIKKHYRFSLFFEGWVRVSSNSSSNGGLTK